MFNPSGNENKLRKLWQNEQYNFKYYFILLSFLLFLSYWVIIDFSWNDRTFCKWELIFFLSCKEIQQLDVIVQTLTSLKIWRHARYAIQVLLCDPGMRYRFSYGIRGMRYKVGDTGWKKEPLLDIQNCCILY